MSANMRQKPILRYDIRACLFTLRAILTATEGWMGLLPDTQNCGLRMRWECRERFPRHRLQRKPLVSDPGMHHGTCVTHVPWCESGSLTRGDGENAPGIPGACATRNFAYLVRGPCCNIDQCFALCLGAVDTFSDDRLQIEPGCVWNVHIFNMTNQHTWKHIETKHIGDIISIM